MKYYLGLDLSLTGTGVAVLDDTGAIVCTKTLAFKDRGMERLHKISETINGFLCKYEPEVVAIEGYSMGSRAGQAFSIGELGGVVKLLLWKSGYNDPLIIAPTRLKKYITGKGNSPKDTIMMHVYKNWRYEPENNNVADAYGLARIALTYNSKEFKLLKHQQDVIDTLRKGE